MTKINKIAILGAGNGGQAMAAHLAIKGFQVNLWDRKLQRITSVQAQGGISLEGQLSGFGKLEKITTNIESAIIDADVIMVVTTADAHGEIALKCAPFLKDGQIIVLNPGRTCGALEFKKVLEDCQIQARVYVAEAQSLIYACRIIGPAVVHVFGVKKFVPLAAMPAIETKYVLDSVSTLYDCFSETDSVLHNGFNNVGTILHTSISLLNTSRIEGGDIFAFYHSLTPTVGNFIEKLDEERLSVGRAYGCDPLSLMDWVTTAYKLTGGDTLYSRLRTNPAYDKIMAPTTLNTRQFFEDVPTGLVPISELGKVAGIDTPLMRSLICLISALREHDYMKEGRTLKKLGLEGMTRQEIIAYMYDGKK